MPFITKYLFLTILLSPSIIFLGYYFKNKIMIILYAVLNALISSLLLIIEILRYSASETTIKEKVHFFFANDSVIIFYLAFIPLIIAGSLLPAIFCMIKFKRGRRKSN